MVLFRVDERLIHGQVVVGWVRRYHPSRLIVVNNELAIAPIEQNIYRTGLPEGLGADFWSEDEAARRLPQIMASSECVFVLTEDLGTMWRLAEAGVPITEVNVGGLHAGGGRRRVLPYVCLDAEDQRRIRDLEAAGVRVVAQDVPTAAPVRLRGEA
jgi:mannose/fructose/N-acetylgalactosamine-specific phosphotransferase system component IIB